MKKYFAMSIIAASVALAACSDDDDDDGDTGVTDPIVTEGEGGEGEPPTAGELPPVATPGEGNTAFDFIATSEDHTQLTELIIQADLADTLDDPAQQFTIFAPTDAAFETLDEDTLAALGDNDVLVRVLQQHVVLNSVQSDEIIAGVGTVAEGEAPFSLATLATGAPAQSLTFTSNSESASGFDITDGSGNTSPLTGPLDQNVSTEVGAPTTGVVHVIETVLMPVAADPVEETVEGEGEVEGGGAGTVSENAGTAQAALESAGTFTTFIGLFAPQSYDDPVNLWTVFAPTDASIPDGVTVDPQNHIFVNGAQTAAELIAAGEITTNGGATFEVTGSETELVVGGNPATLLTTGDSGTLVYSIEGVLQ